MPLPSIPTPRMPRWILLWSLSLALGMLVFAAFGESLTYGFLNWDDIIYIRDYPEVSAGLSWRGVVWAWTHPHYSNWHPLTTLSFMLDTTWFGKDGSKFHAHNVLLHAGTAVLFFLALRRMTGAMWKSAAAAALFAIHPLRVESVAWITERKDVLSGLFLMATLLAYAAYAESPGKNRFWTVAFFFTCGLLSKSILVTVPLLLLLLDFWPLRRADLAPNPGSDWRAVWDAWKPLLREKLPLFALAAASCGATLWSVDEHRPMNPPPFLARLEYIPVWLITYLRFFFLPDSLAAHYPYSPSGPPLNLFLGCLWGILILSFTAWTLRRREPVLLVGWAWFLIAVLPVIGILPPGIQIIADRYTYVSQAALGMACVWGLSGRIPRSLHTLLLAGGIVSLTAMAREQTRHWQNDEALWKRTLKVTAENDFGNGQMGDAYAVQNRLDEAEPHYREALRINPNLPGVLNNLAFVLRSRGKFAEAEPYLRKAVEISPWFTNPRSELAEVLLAQGKSAEALEHLEILLQSEPQNISALYRAGMLRSEGPAELRDLSKAIPLLTLAAELQPAQAEIHLGLGNALFQAGRAPESAVCFEKALQADPRHFRAANNLGTVLVRSQRPMEAAAAYRKALELNPDYPEALDGLAAALLQMKNHADAAEVLLRFERAHPDDPRAVYKRAWLLATAPEASLRNGPEAERLAHRLLEIKGATDPFAADTLAAALAEQGRFEQAHHTARDMLASLEKLPQLPPHAREALQKHAQTFLSSRPWRE